MLEETGWLTEKTNFVTIEVYSFSRMRVQCCKSFSSKSALYSIIRAYLNPSKPDHLWKYICVNLYLGTLRSQQRVLSPLKFKLQVAMSCHDGAATKAESSAGVAGARHHCYLYSFWTIFFFKVLVFDFCLKVFWSTVLARPVFTALQFLLVVKTTIRIKPILR